MLFGCQIYVFRLGCQKPLFIMGRRQHSGVSQKTCQGGCFIIVFGLKARWIVVGHIVLQSLLLRLENVNRSTPEAMVDVLSLRQAQGEMAILLC